MTMTFIKGHCCMRNQNSGVHFRRNFAVDLGEIQCVALSCWVFFKLMLKLFCKLYSRERTLLMCFKK